MGLYDKNVSTSRRVMVIFFIIDSSGSMKGTKIGQVNTASEDIMKEIRKLSEDNTSAEIKVCVLDFATKATWMTPEPVSVEAKEYKWDYVEAGGLTAMGDAFRKMNEALSKDKFMKEKAGSFAPVLFLMSDGEPTDDYRSGLEVLKCNNWFKAAIKVAIGIGDDANMSVLEEFTGSKESVVTTHTPEELKKWIQFIAMRSSQIGSQSSNAAGDNKNAQVQEEIDKEKKKEETEPKSVPAPKPVPTPKPPKSGTKDSEYLAW